MPGSDAFGAEVAENLQTVRRRIHAAAHLAQRSPADIRLIAVSKTFGADAVRAAAAAGHRDFGENRVQEALDKIDELNDLSLTWHLIGHLQSNKARRAAVSFGWIHAIDSTELMRKVDAAAIEAGVRPRVLVQADLAHETTKHGADEQAVGDVVKAALDSRACVLAGLMIVPPIPDHPEQSRPWFRRLRDLRDALVAGGVPAASLRELSMGMSHDYEVAVSEGATMVRVGSAVFGRRPAAPAKA